MSLVRWEPFKELEKFFGYTPRLATETGMTLAEWMPTVDIEETNEEYVVKAELPGMKKEDMKISFKDDVLAIHGERKAEKEERGKKFLRVERSYGTFYRSFLIPDEVIAEKIFAENKEGVLFVHLPKSMEKKEKEKLIEVKVH